MTDADMLKETFLELSQPDLKAIGRSRGFDPETIASKALLEHVFLSEQGVASALALLTSEELAGLHLLHHLRDDVNVEFFKRMYPELVPPNPYGSYNQRYKALSQKVQTELVRKGLLLFCTRPEASDPHSTILERKRFRFPAAFGAWLPAPFAAQQLDPANTGQRRHEIPREKVLEILRLGNPARQDPALDGVGQWRLKFGELSLGGESGPFRLKHLIHWQTAQFEAAVGYSSKEVPRPFWPVPLLLYAFSRLRKGEWLAAKDLLPLWKAALPRTKTPEPQFVCETGYQWGCVEKIELNGSTWYRFAGWSDTEASTPPEEFLKTDHADYIGIRLERVPFTALERLCEISRLELGDGELHATPNLIKLGHASDETLADPLLGWLREHHPALRSTMERLEERRGKLIVHENLLVARINDLALKVMLEKEFGGPGRLVAISDQYVAFPRGLLREIQSWMKKSGHVIKTVEPEQAGRPIGGKNQTDE